MWLVYYVYMEILIIIALVVGIIIGSIVTGIICEGITNSFFPEVFTKSNNIALWVAIIFIFLWLVYLSYLITNI